MVGLPTKDQRESLLSYADSSGSFAEGRLSGNINITVQNVADGAAVHSSPKWLTFHNPAYKDNSAISDMNLSSVNGTFTAAGRQRDTFAGAVTKNVIVTALCISINYINGTLVHTFRKHQCFVCLLDSLFFFSFTLQIFSSSPRYILFIHLVINDMTQLFLSALLYVISYTLYTINVPLCLILLLIAVPTTFNTPLNLAGMAVECYIAVCIPLRHGLICTVTKTYILIGLIWVASSLSILPDLFTLLATEPLHFFHSKILCTSDVVFRRIHSLRNRDLSDIVCLVLVWLILFYTYFRILFAAKGATVDSKKARNTILLHGFQLLLCMLTYVKPMFEQGLLYLLPKQHLSILFASYVFTQILPRFVSPIVYGLRDQTFKRYVRKYLLCGVSTSSHPQNVTVPNMMPPVKQQ
ncbi:odorant receptor 131-2-like [Trachinotus anak]|uniref:odorant receptor 131-2-like n=1 Tax=Trachinotus anak TaxID=443729 RepID=UPI0039F21579